MNDKIIVLDSHFPKSVISNSLTKEEKDQQQRDQVRDTALAIRSAMGNAIAKTTKELVKEVLTGK